MYPIKPTDNHIYTELGTFKINSGQIRVSDPCYDLSSTSAETLKVKNGSWETEITESDTDSFFGIRVSELTIWHSSEEYFNFDKVTEEPFDVCVDAGCCGFFDLASYPPQNWIELITNKTAGIFKNGVLSSSGLGDGEYPCYFYKNNQNEIIAAKLIFLFEDDEVE